jgi:site-specific DNA-methyltransferase (adenine-specific)
MIVDIDQDALNREIEEGVVSLRNRVQKGDAERPRDSGNEFSLFEGDALDAYDTWAAPMCIISDGPYGLGKYPGEAVSPMGLADWYAPHAAAWARHALPSTTLWFWNSEIGWANAHPALEKNGWQYEETVI